MLSHKHTDTFMHTIWKQNLNSLLQVEYMLLCMLLCLFSYCYQLSFNFLLNLIKQFIVFKNLKIKNRERSLPHHWATASFFVFCLMIWVYYHPKAPYNSCKYQTCYHYLNLLNYYYYYYDHYSLESSFRVSFSNEAFRWHNDSFLSSFDYYCYHHHHHHHLIVAFSHHSNDIQHYEYHVCLIYLNIYLMAQCSNDLFVLIWCHQINYLTLVFRVHVNFHHLQNKI